MIGWVTLDVGAAALVYSFEGAARVVHGPERLFLWREKIVHMRCFSANQNQYLKIKHSNGEVEHKAGPCTMYCHPIHHLSISTAEGINLDANEVLVMYGPEDKGAGVTRYLQYGPQVFIPKANEWMHEFSWHGTDPANKTRMIPGGLTFTKLQVIPDQFYYNVDEVRTADDALLRIKLMMFYELKDIEIMVTSFNSAPIADFINCLCADVIAFASKLTYMEFIDKSGDLNDLHNYRQLLERCKKIGYEVSKVVFRGYYASPRLQSMHDDAIRTRTQLKIAYETEEQQQAMTDMKMKNEAERIAQEQSMELTELEHTQKMERSQAEHQLGIETKNHFRKTEHHKQNRLAEIASMTAKDGQLISHYENLNNLGVNLTDFIIGQSRQPEKLVRLVANEKTANLHLHH